MNPHKDFTVKQDFTVAKLGICHCTQYALTPQFRLHSTVSLGLDDDHLLIPVTAHWSFHAHTQASYFVNRYPYYGQWMSRMENGYHI